MLLQVLQGIFDPTFSEHSYGFRPKRSAHAAVRAAQGYVQAGKDRVVDRDITKFFDRVNHDLLMNRIGQTIREYWQSCQSLSSNELRDDWRAFVRGWWAYFHLAEERRNIFDLEGWIRRHLRQCFWQRWHDWRGREKKLKKLGLHGRRLLVAHSSKGAWRIAASPSLQQALNNGVLRRFGFLVPSDLAASM